MKLNRFLYLMYEVFVQIRRSCTLLPVVLYAKFANDTENYNQRDNNSISSMPLLQSFRNSNQKLKMWPSAERNMCMQLFVEDLSVK